MSPKAIRERVGVLKEFQAFLLRGNLVDLAVAVVVGTAFTVLVKSFTSAFITPLVSFIFGGSSAFGDWQLVLSRTPSGQPKDVLAYGVFLNDLLSFLITCAVVFFFIVKPVGALMRRMGYAPPADPQREPCPQCTTEIPVKAKRCPQCTSPLVEGWATPLEAGTEPELS